MATPYDDQVKAATMLARRAGASEFRVEQRPIATTSQWAAVAAFDVEGERYEKTGLGSNPGFACDKLAEELLDGAVCRRCSHIILLDTIDKTFCRWHRVGDVWVSGCGRSVDENVEMEPKLN